MVNLLSDDRFTAHLWSTARSYLTPAIKRLQASLYKDRQEFTPQRQKQEADVNLVLTPSVY